MKDFGEKLSLLKLNTFLDDRGGLGVLELKDYVDWDAKRIYYVFDVVKARGGHAVKHEKKVYICLRGTIKAKLHDGEKWHEFEMKGPDDAILMKEMCYREFYDFSEDAILLAVSSVNYVAEDYIYDFDEFLEFVN